MAELAVVTGASRGIGLELARQLAGRGFKVVAAAEEPITDLDDDVLTVEVDLATAGGVEHLAEVVAIFGRPEVVAVNAGGGVEGAFVDTALAEHLRLVGRDVSGSVHLVHRLLPGMVAGGSGSLLLSSSGGVASSPYRSTSTASEAFLEAFAEELRVELAGTGVTVAALMPGAADPADVARGVLDALFAGTDHGALSRRS